MKVTYSDDQVLKILRAAVSTDRLFLFLKWKSERVTSRFRKNRPVQRMRGACPPFGRVLNTSPFESRPVDYMTGLPGTWSPRFEA